MNGTNWGVSVSWFIVILAMVPVCLWLLKRSGWVPGQAGLRGFRTKIADLRILETLPLSPTQRLMRVLEKRPDGSEHHVLLAVGTTHVSCIHSYPVNAEEKNPPDFQHALAQVQVNEPSKASAT